MHATGRDILTVGFIATVSLVLVAYGTSSGPGISPDSVSYAAAARSLANGDGLLDFTGEALATFPPGLSLVLGGLVALGIDLNAAVVIVNLVALAITVVLTYILARLVLPTFAWSIAVTALVAWARVTTEVFSMLWSESLFVPLVLAIAIVLVRGYRRGHVTWSDVVLISVALALLISVRYSGIFLIAAVFLTVLLMPTSTPIVRLGRALTVIVLPFIVLFAIVMRNIRNGQGILGDRYPSAQSLQGALVSATEALGSSIMWRGTTSITIIIGAFAVVLALVGSWWGLIHRFATLPVTILAFTYAAGTVISQSSTRLDDASERLGYPVYPLIAVLAAMGLWVMVRTAWRQIRERWPNVSAPVTKVIALAPTVVVALLVIALGLANSVRFAIDAHRDGLGYRHVERQESETAQRIKELPPDAVLATNEPWLVAWLRPESVTFPLPPPTSEWPADRILQDERRILSAVAAGETVYAAVISPGLPWRDLDELQESGLSLHDADGISPSNDLEVFLIRQK